MGDERLPRGERAFGAALAVCACGPRVRAEVAT
jgi:hypothetical protein